MTIGAFKNVALAANDHPNIHEHRINLRSDFLSIQFIVNKKNVVKIFRELLKHLQTFFLNLNTKLTTQSQLNEVIINNQTGFERVCNRIQHDTQQLTCTLNELVQDQNNIDSFKQQDSEIAFDASNTCLLIKLRNQSNKIFCRDQISEKICLKINKTIQRDTFLLIFFENLYEENNQ